jgi:hypothetical protein
VQRITTPTVNSHPLIPLSEGEKATVRKHRLKNKKVALVRPTVHRPPPPPPPPHTLTHFIPNAAYLINKQIYIYRINKQTTRMIRWIASKLLTFIKTYINQHIALLNESRKELLVGGSC